MSSFDWTSLITGVVGLGAGLTAFNHKVKALAAKIEPLAVKVEHVYEHVKASKETKQVVQELKITTQSETEADRKASIKAAAYCAITAIGADLNNISDVQKAAIAKFIKDSVPEKFKDSVTPGTVDTVISVINDELAAAKQHDGIQVAQKFIDWLNQEKKEVTLSTDHKQEQSEQTDPAPAESIEPQVPVTAPPVQAQLNV